MGVGTENTFSPDSTARDVRTRVRKLFAVADAIFDVFAIDADASEKNKFLYRNVCTF